MAGGDVRFTQRQQGRLGILKAEDANPSYAFMAALQQLELCFSQSEFDVWQSRSFATIYADPQTGMAGTQGVLAQQFGGRTVETHFVLMDGSDNVILRIERYGKPIAQFGIEPKWSEQINFWYTPNGKRVTAIVGNPPAAH